MTSPNAGLMLSHRLTRTMAQHQTSIGSTYSADVIIPASRRRRAIVDLMLARHLQRRPTVNVALSMPKCLFPAIT